MAATAVDTAKGTGTGTGSRRAVVRSEKFMEWQREISRSVSAVRKLGHSSALVTAERHSSDEENVKVAKEEGSEEREGEGEEPVGDSQGGADVAAPNQERPKGKRPQQQQQQQRQRSDAKKGRKEEEGVQKKGISRTGKDSAAAGEGEGGRMRRCKPQGNPGGAVRRAVPEVATQQQQVAQPLARRRQRRLPRPFTPPKEDVERGLRSLTRNRGGEAVAVAAKAIPTISSKGATKRSKRVAQRLANEEPAPPPLKLPKLHLVLSRKEIQEDWLKITGHKYSGKPRKSTLVSRVGSGVVYGVDMPVFDSISERTPMTGYKFGDVTMLGTGQPLVFRASDPALQVQ